MSELLTVSTTNLPEAPEVEGQTETSKAAMRNAIDTMASLATTASERLKEGKTTVRAVSKDGAIVELPSAEKQEKDRSAVIERVGRFLDVKLQGPRFIGSARGKLFVGEYPRQQAILDVQLLVGAKMDQEVLTVGQFNVAVIDELRSSLFGWIPISSPKAQLLRSNIDKGREEWKRLGIELNAVEWLASRDPYVLEQEVRPLWEQYVAWKAEVEPTKEDFDFYYGLM